MLRTLPRGSRLREAATKHIEMFKKQRRDVGAPSPAKEITKTGRRGAVPYEMNNKDGTLSKSRRPILHISSHTAYIFFKTKPRFRLFSEISVFTVFFRLIIVPLYFPLCFPSRFPSVERQSNAFSLNTL